MATLLQDLAFHSDLLYTRLFGTPAKGNSLDQADVDMISNKVKMHEGDAHIVGHSRTMIEDVSKIKELLT